MVTFPIHVDPLNDRTMWRIVERMSCFLPSGLREQQYMLHWVICLVQKGSIWCAANQQLLLGFAIFFLSAICWPLICCEMHRSVAPSMAHWTPCLYEWIQRLLLLQAWFWQSASKHGIGKLGKTMRPSANAMLCKWSVIPSAMSRFLAHEASQCQGKGTRTPLVKFDCTDFFASQKCSWNRILHIWTNQSLTHCAHLLNSETLGSSPLGIDLLLNQTCSSSVPQLPSLIDTVYESLTCWKG